jgi:predicted hydrocarbon binding protein
MVSSLSGISKAGGRTLSFPAEVRGGSVLALLAGLGPFRARAEQILSESGIHSWDVEQWVPLDAYLRALRTVGESFGQKMLEQIGMQVPHHLVLPLRVEGFAAMMAAIPDVYAMNHRGLGGDAIRYELTGDASATLVSCTSYPCEFERGMIQGCFDLLLGTCAEVGEATPAECRDSGALACTYRVSAAAASA